VYSLDCLVSSFLVTFVQC